MRSFGCLCFASSLSSKRTKFTARAIPSIFVGYPPGYKAYKLYNLQTRSFFISRDVIFHESTYPFHALPQSEPVLDPFPDLVLPIPNLDAIPSSPTDNILPPNQPLVPPAPALEPAIHHDISTSAPLTRKSTRTSRPPSYLNDFYCNLTTSCPYPLSDYLCYRTLSPSYSNYVMQVSSVFEPQFFH